MQERSMQQIKADRNKPKSFLKGLVLALLALAIEASLLGLGPKDSLSLTLQAQAKLKGEQEVHMAQAYEQQGLYKKALQWYENSQRKGYYTETTHSRYFSLLVRLKKYTKAERYLLRMLKKHAFPILWVDLLYLYNESTPKKAKQILGEIKKRVKKNTYQLHVFARYLAQKRLYEEALVLYLAGKSRQKDPSVYDVPIAQLYFTLGQRSLGFQYYLSYLKKHPNYLRSFKELLKSPYLVKEDIDTLSQVLNGYRQAYNDSRALLELSVWLHSRKGRYQEAFAELRLADKRHTLPTQLFLDLGKKVMQAKNYEVATSIYQYILQSHPESLVTRYAHYALIYAKEQSMRHQVFYERKPFVDLAQRYKKFIAQGPRDTHSLKAQLNLAKLYIEQIQAPDSAITLLKRILPQVRSSDPMHAKMKLALGDAYFLWKKPWQAMLYYAQVEREAKDKQWVEKAQLRLARTSYHQASFALAKEQLKVLREASTKEIANDALLLVEVMDWFLGDATDSLGGIMLQQLAHAERMISQKTYAPAIQIIQQLINTYAEKGATQEAIHYARYVLAKAHEKQGDFVLASQAINPLLDRPSSLLHDKALMAKAQLVEKQLNKAEESKALYLQLLKDHPESIYIPEVRRRLRRLKAPPPQESPAHLLE